MPTIENITEELIHSLAPNAAAILNAKKISRSGDFISLYKSQDNTLIFGECRGSGKKPYNASADFSGDSPVFRCSCPSRQFPCKHSLAIMFEWLAKKDFAISDIPEDIIKKREKIFKRTEKENNTEEKEKKKKTNKTAVAKKLKKQAEGLELAKNFVNDLLSRGISSVSNASAEQYNNIAKQLGDYYLPGLQAIMNEIINIIEKCSSDFDDIELNHIISLCVKLSSTIKKSNDYIKLKLESGNVMLEDNILYEAMGGIWKLEQLKELGLYKENAHIIQLSFNIINDEIHKALIDFAYWIDIDSGEISKTKNIRPLKALKHIKEEDSSFGIYNIKELCYYPGGINKRIRWESADISYVEKSVYRDIISKAESSINNAIKKAKNELKNTLSDSSVCLLVSFDSIEFSKDNQCILKYGTESIMLKSNKFYPDTCSVISMLNKDMLSDGALLGEIFYNFEEPPYHFA